MYVETTKKDIVWNYIGTIISMGSGFFLLPLLMMFLTSDELGLWYIFIAIANLSSLFEFGFNPTFARNIVYVISGARHLTSTGCDASSVRDGIDWHLLNTVIKASQVMYAIIAFATLLGLSVIGTCYIAYVSKSMVGIEKWIAWAVFLVSIFLNLYFLNTLTVLRGYGDIAGENRSKTYSKLLQIIASGLLLVSGFGLIGSALGFLLSGLSLRMFAGMEQRKHREIMQGRLKDNKRVTLTEICSIIKTIKGVAVRDGIVQISNFSTTQATSIIASLFLNLTETGVYSVLLQLASAVYNFAGAYPKAFIPSFQADHIAGKTRHQRKLAAKGTVAYWFLWLIGVVGTILVVFPLISIIKPGFMPDLLLYVVMCLYLGLWNQHSFFCSYIGSMNEIPYMPAYVISSLTGIFLSAFGAGILGLGAWGIVFGQAICQIVYNNWKWPHYLAVHIGTSYFKLIVAGFREWSRTFQCPSTINE